MSHQDPINILSRLSVPGSAPPPSLPRLDFDSYAECRPAQDWGGDFHNLIALDNGGLAVALGDVAAEGAGHGMPLPAIKTLLHALAGQASGRMGRWLAP